MMDFTWYILGTLTGGVIYGMYLLSEKFVLNWLSWFGLGVGAGLILFSIAWARASAPLKSIPGPDCYTTSTLLAGGHYGVAGSDHIGQVVAATRGETRPRRHNASVVLPKFRV